MKTKSTNKIGAVFLMSALALAGIGFSYAGFTDTISISGTVNTATVEFETVDYSGTWVYKVFGNIREPPPGEIYIDYEGLTPDELVEMFGGVYGTNIIPISSATAADGQPDYDAIFTFDNLIACIDYKADLKATIGTLPVKINAITLTPLNGASWILPLIPNDINVKLWLYRDDDPRVQIGVGSQIHPGDVVECELWVHIPQDNAYQGVSGSLQVTVDIMQWNGECKEVTLPPKELNLPPPPPEGNLLSATYTNPGPSSYWKVDLSNVPGGYDVTNGAYLGWCCDQDTYIYNGHTLTIYLMSSYDAMNPWPGTYWYSWPCVNYILNNKHSGSITQVQDAIWYFIDHGYSGSDPLTWTIINDALANGKYFVPQTGQWEAVLCIGDPLVQDGLTVQHTFIEVDP